MSETPLELKKVTDFREIMESKIESFVKKIIEPSIRALAGTTNFEAIEGRDDSENSGFERKNNLARRSEIYDTIIGQLEEVISDFDYYLKAELLNNADSGDRPDWQAITDLSELKTALDYIELILPNYITNNIKIKDDGTLSESTDIHAESIILLTKAYLIYKRKTKLNTNSK